MGEFGNGYGSECHLLRFMGRHRRLFNMELLESLGLGIDIEWLDFNFNSRDRWPDSEYKGLAFLNKTKYDRVLNQWKDFWPQTGNAPNWDTIGWLHKSEGEPELILLEAKAHLEEIKSDCGANPKSLNIIAKAMDQAQQGLGIATPNSWLKEYYQYANRLAILWFLHHNQVPARLILIYFLGDDFKGKTCPKDSQGWAPALKAQDNHLGLSQGHKLERFVHKVFLPVKF